MDRSAIRLGRAQIDSMRLSRHAGIDLSCFNNREIDLLETLFCFSSASRK